MAAAGRPKADACPRRTSRSVFFFHGAVAGRLDQQPLDWLGTGDEILQVLTEAWAVAIEVEGVGIRGEGRRKRDRLGRRVPSFQPSVAVFRRARGGEETGQQLQRGDAEIGTRPVHGDNRIAVPKFSQLRRRDCMPARMLADYRNPRVGKKIEHTCPIAFLRHQGRLHDDGVNLRLCPGLEASLLHQQSQTRVIAQCDRGASRCLYGYRIAP